MPDVLCFIESDPSGKPIGVWAIDAPGDRLAALEVGYLQEHDDAAQRAREMIARLLDAGVDALPEDFMDFHSLFFPPQYGFRSEVRTEKRFRDSKACVIALLHEIRSG